MQKGTFIQSKGLQLNLDNLNRLLHSKIPRQKKSGNVPARKSNPRPSACKADAQPTLPPAPNDAPGYYQYSQEQVIYKLLSTRIYKFIGWRAGGRHFKEVGLVNLGVPSGKLSFSKSDMVDKRGHHGIGLAMLLN